MSLLYFFSCIYECYHDLSISSTISFIDLGPFSTKKAHREPIRLYFDLDPVIQDSDPLMCTTKDDNITWRNKVFPCTERDLLSPNKKDVLNQTLSNLQDFIESSFNVTRTTKPIVVTSISFYKRKPFKKSNIDVHVTISVPPFGPNSNQVAVSTSGQLSTVDNRPVTGIIFINPAFIPSTPQSYESKNRTFFNVLFHELMHALGFSSELHSFWINRSTGTPYNPFPLVQEWHNGRLFYFLRTPQAMQFARLRHGQQARGIELEDRGGSGTALDHVKARAYFNDAMSGLIMDNAVISDLDFALMEDTGYYDVEYMHAELLPWGDPHSIGAPLEEVEVGPPKKVFPKHYFCAKDSPQLQCHYDFKATGKCIPETRMRCPGNPYFCQSPSFFDPFNEGVVGAIDLYDFLRVIAPSEICKSGEMCAMMKFTDDNTSVPQCLPMLCEGDSVSISVGLAKYSCSKANEEIVVEGTNIALICPDPSLVCSMIKFLREKSQMERSGSAFISMSSIRLDLIKMLFINIGAVTLCLAILFCYRREKYRRNPDDGTELLLENIEE